VLHRLVTDPLDGRLVERSVKSYRPDRAMAQQVAAADRHCRAPACLVPAARCERDHEDPFVDGRAGGKTSEANLNLKHGRHHQLKTWQVWSTTMDESRNVTWQTLFGRCYPTRPHDYRQYGDDWLGRARRESMSQIRAEAMAQVAADPDWRDRAIYAALSHRDGGDWLAGDDDHAENALALGADTAYLDPDVPIRLRHRLPGGIRRNGPPPGQLSPELALLDRHGTATQQEPGSEDHLGAEPDVEPPPF
jgi:hypothetical protein